MSQGFISEISPKIDDATFITKTPNAHLKNEQALSSLATGYLKVTTTTGVVSSQAVPILVADGGTNATAFANTNGAIYGGDPLAHTAEGASNTALHGNTGSAPTYSVISLTADVSGTLPVGNGGTGVTSLTANGIIYGGATLGVTAEGATGTVLHGNTSAAPSFAAVDVSTATVSGTLPIANGGTNNASAYTSGSVIFSSGSALTQDNANLFWKNTATEALILGGTTVAAGDIVLNVSGASVFNEQGGFIGIQSVRVESDNNNHLFIINANADIPRISRQGEGDGGIAALSGSLIQFNASLGDQDFRVEGDNQSHLIFVDASEDKVGIRTSSPHSTLHVNGGLAVAVRTVTGSYDLSVEPWIDHTILGDAEAQALGIGITLPSAATAGRMYVIKKINPNVARTVTINAQPAQTIDGSAVGVVLAAQYAGRWLMAGGGTNWNVLEAF